MPTTTDTSLDNTTTTGFNEGALAGGDASASVRPIVDRLADSAHRAIDRLAGAAGPALERVRSSAASTVDSMGQRMDDLGASKDEWAESARGTVRDNPLAAVGVAFAVGWLISRLSR